MTWTVETGSFVLLGFPEPPGDADLACLADPPGQIVREAGETTLLVRGEHAPGILARHPRARLQRDLAWIRFDTPMSWNVVGFLALVSRKLAEAGVPIGAVCGFGRDHLFVARERLATASAVLERVFPGGARSASAR